MELIFKVKIFFKSKNFKNAFNEKTCKGNDTVVSLLAGDDKRPAQA